MASSVTPPTEEEGTEVDRAVEAEGATVYIGAASTEAMQNSA